MLQAIGKLYKQHYHSFSRLNMASIATYVFLDLETTGFPPEENNLTKITELSLVAVKRNHFLDTRPGATPRVQHKLTLCFNPGRPIEQSCTNVTGLDNFLLEKETTFNKQVSELISNFINLLTKPVCFIAQNGYNFDYPILKNHFEKLKLSLSEDLLCSDCFFAFHDILERRKANITNENTKEVPVENSFLQEKDVVDKADELLIGQALLQAPNTLVMKVKNETTPKQAPKTTVSTPGKVLKARKRLPWSEGSKPTESYKLQNIHKRLFNRPAVEAHRAENDCILALECAVALGEEFVKWVDENNVLFSDIKPMRPGVRLGY